MSSVQVIDLAKRFEADGVSAIVYTDIAKDGMMQGCNVPFTKALAEATRIPVIASGAFTTWATSRRCWTPRPRA